MDRILFESGNTPWDFNIVCPKKYNSTRPIIVACGKIGGTGAMSDPAHQAAIYQSNIDTPPAREGTLGCHDRSSSLGTSRSSKKPSQEKEEGRRDQDNNPPRKGQDRESNSRLPHFSFGFATLLCCNIYKLLRAPLSTFTSRNRSVPLLPSSHIWMYGWRFRPAGGTRSTFVVTQSLAVYQE